MAGGAQRAKPKFYQSADAEQTSRQRRGDGPTNPCLSIYVWDKRLRSEIYQKLAENYGYTYPEIADMTHVQWRSAMGLDKEDAKHITFATDKERIAWMQKQALKRFHDKQKHR